MKNEHGPLPVILAPVAWCGARLYGIGARLIDQRHRSRAGMRVPVPVISVGNLTVGGTGKTPVTKRIAQAILEAGGRPAIALRGYRAKSTGGSDEAREYHESLPGVPVLVGADRAQSIMQALKSDPDSFDCVLLDDGFQHRGLHRDLDIVLVDSSRPGVFGDLLPNGWLREPVSALTRADCVILTNHIDDDVPERLELLLREVSGNSSSVRCHHGWSEVLVHHSGIVESLTPQEVAARHGDVLVVSGLGNPDAMLDSVKSHGFSVSSHLRHRDHAAYSDADARVLLQKVAPGEAILIPAKDWVKLRELPSIQGCSSPILVPQVRIEFSAGASDLSRLLSQACGHLIAL